MVLSMGGDMPEEIQMLHTIISSSIVTAKRIKSRSIWNTVSQRGTLWGLCQNRYLLRTNQQERLDIAINERS